MKKICLTTIGICLFLFQGFSQTSETDTSGYRSKKLTLDEVSLVSGYYDQTADKSAVMGGRPDYKGIADVTDFSNGIEIKFVSRDKKTRKNSLSAGLGYDYHTAASQAYVDSNGTSRNDGSRLYPTLNWTIENELKGKSFGLGFYYSAEHNYYHSVGLNTNFSKKNHHNGEFGLKLSGFFDQIKMIYPAEFIPPASAPSTNSPTDSIVTYTTASGQTEYKVINTTTGEQTGSSTHVKIPSKPRNTFTGSFSFSQVINTRLQASLLMDLVYQEGYLGLPFHRVYFNTGKDTIENLPSQRLKVPIGLRLNYFLGDRFILKSYFRFYVDSWGIVSQTASLEIPVKLSAFLSLSPFYRFYNQSAANYFAPYQIHNESEKYYTSNYELAAFSSSLAGIGLRLAPPGGVLIKSLNALEIRYGHYSQSVRLNANMITVYLNFR
jgi:Protein of unknown function (DUF3570)